MKKKLVLKPFVLPILYISMIIMLMWMSTIFIYQEENEDLTYVSDSIFDDSIPVISDEEIFILSPYTSDQVTVKVKYYNHLDETSNQESSIVIYDNTYLQNTGVTYSSTEQFDIVAIMDGTVTKVYENDVLGNIIEITHDKNMISVYQMLGEVSVKVDQIVNIGDVIGKSGVSDLSEEANNLHFELIKDGINVNPSEYIGKNIKEI